MTERDDDDNGEIDEVPQPTDEAPDEEPEPPPEDDD